MYQNIGLFRKIHESKLFSAKENWFCRTGIDSSANHDGRGVEEVVGQRLGAVQGPKDVKLNLRDGRGSAVANDESSVKACPELGDVLDLPHGEFGAEGNLGWGDDTVCACVCVCARVCVRVCVCARACVCVCVCVW